MLGGLIYMKVIITGMNGTLAPYVADEFKTNNWEVVTWNRALVPIDNQELINKFIENEKPNAFIHIATGPIEWIEKIIIAIKPFHIPLVYISSESVFDFEQEGPFTPDVVPKSRDDYGRYKLACENALLSDYEEHSYIIRLGWQIALHTHKNNMLAFLVTKEHIKASDKWIPSTSFMPDSAKGIYTILTKLKPEIYHLDGNLGNWSFYKIVSLLKQAFLLPITVEQDNELIRNNRLLNEPILIDSIEKRINELMKVRTFNH